MNDGTNVLKGLRRSNTRTDGRARAFASLAIIATLLLTSSLSVGLPVDQPNIFKKDQRDHVNKVVLGEMFTATWCGPCVSADAGMDRVLNDPVYFDSRFVLVQYHVNDEYATDGGDERNSYYRISSIPTVVFDGQDEVVGSQEEAYDNEMVYKQHIDSKSSTGDVSIDMESDIVDEHGTFSTTLVIENDLPWTPFGLTLYGFLVEDEKEELDSGHILRMTARSKIFEVNGIRIRNQGEALQVNGSFEVQAGWVRDDLAIVTWLQNDNTYEVLQAAISYPEISGVGPINQAPMYIGGDLDFSMEEDATDSHIILENQFHDQDGDHLIYSAEGSLNINVSIDLATTVLTIVPGPDWSGTETIYISAKDEGHPPTTHPVTVTITPVNDPPRLIGRLTGLVLDEDTNTLTSPITSIFFEPDGDPLTYQIETMVHLRVVKNSDETLAMTPTENWNGYENLVIKASDGDYETIYDDTVRVNPVNDPPTIDSYYPMDWVEVDEGQELTLSVTASDLEGDHLTYIWEMDGGEVPGSGSSFIYEPAYGDGGEHVVLVKVTDGSDIASHAFHILVVIGNRPPTAVITSPTDGQTFKEGIVVVFTSEAEDPDDPRGRHLEHTWTIDGEVVSIEPQFTSRPKKGTHTVVLTVSDDEYEVKDTVTIVVEKKDETAVPGFELTWVVLALAMVFVFLRKRRR